MGSEGPRALRQLEADVVVCRACPRLVAWREQVALERRAAFRDEEYWGRPVPGFGDPAARDLWNLLGSVYQSKPEVRALTTQAGLDPIFFNWDQAMR